MQGVLPIDWSLSPEELAARQVTMLKAGVLGPPNGRPESTPEMQEMYFDIVKRVANADAINGAAMTIQWSFTDAQPWHLRIDNGSTAAEPGTVADPDVVIETTWEDWLNVSAKSVDDPRRLLLRRRIRPKGSLRNLLRLTRVFPPRPSKLS
jgi:hypothetical protein